MQNSIVSIIVPVYNTEKYIYRCLDSLIKQTYKDIEIIIIDDGSTDNSYQIYNSFLKMDKRIKLISQKNKGLSSARNIGIQAATGEFIMFVDSDDWLPLNALQIMMKYMISNIDIISGEIVEVYNEKINNTGNKNGSIEYLIKEDALEKLMYLHTISNSASGKLYRKKLFNTIRYPVGKYYEDLGTTYKIFANANLVITIKQPVYYYFQNNINSIRHIFIVNKRLDGLYFAIEELRFIEKEYPNIMGAAIYRLFYECLSILNDMPYKCEQKKQILKIVQKYRSQVIRDHNLYKKQTALCLSSYFGQPMIKVAFAIRKFVKIIKNYHH